MKASPEKISANRHSSVADEIGHNESNSQVASLEAKNAGISAQRKLQDIANDSPQVKQLQAVQEMADAGLKMNSVAQRQKSENNTGLPDNLKSGVESLSGYSLNDVNVHYNSPRPAQLQAHAYAQGADIHVAPGQEKHLPHEAWHIVQQKQGRVQPTMQMKKVAVNDDPGLESEADQMGEKATRFNPDLSNNDNQLNASDSSNDSGAISAAFQLKKLVKNKLNVVGENHEESGQRRDAEIALGAREAGGKYYKEHEFRARARTVGEAVFGESSAKPRAFADPLYLRIAHRVQFLSKFNSFHDIIPAWDVTDIPTSGTIKTLGTTLLSQSETNIIELRGLITEALKNEEKDNYDETQAGLLNTINTLNSGTVIPEFLKLKTAWAALTPGVALTAAVNDPLALYKKGVDDMLVGANGLGGNNLAETRIKRSTAMDTVSTSRKNDKGVWKVGQAHYDDMQAGGAKEYNLVSQDEFNAEYKELPLLQGGIMVPQP